MCFVYVNLKIFLVDQPAGPARRWVSRRRAHHPQRCDSQNSIRKVRVGYQLDVAVTSNQHSIARARFKMSCMSSGNSSYGSATKALWPFDE
jgi:hypothetical protein